MQDQHGLASTALVETPVGRVRLPARLQQFLQRSRDNQFWAAQVVGWFGLSLVSYASLTLWYNQPEFVYILHNLLQSVLGIFVSWPMRWVFRRVWETNLLPRLIVSLIAALLFAAIWSVLRLWTFEMMTGETNLWQDFGGWLFTSIFIFVCWMASYHGVKYYQLLQQEHDSLMVMSSAQKEESLRRAQAESMAQEAQLKLLRYQLNPHFLFNTLNAISSLVTLKEADKANAMLVQLSKFLRYSLDNGGDINVPLQQEVEALQLYLKIEQARFADRLTVIIDVDDSVSRVEVPSLLLQPLVENAIKHAIALSEKGGVIRVRAAPLGDRLNVWIADSGSGQNTQSDSGSGVGLQNIRERLRMRYGDRASLSIEHSDLGGLEALLQMPLDNSQ